jgi:ATP-dependent Clp protease adapter protein ClpS
MPNPNESETIEIVTIPDTVPADITELAPLFKVLLHNDNETNAYFVMGVLREVFLISAKKAEEVTAEAHTNGIGLVKVMGETEAETSVNIAHAMARGRGYPLTFTIEEA